MIRDDYEEIGASIGRLIQEKQAAYGDSFNRANEILRVLYPEGVSPDKYRDFLAVTRVIDKLFRIATDRDALGESPWRDVMGYALLSLAHPEELPVENEPEGLEHVNVEFTVEAAPHPPQLIIGANSPFPPEPPQFRDDEILCEVQTAADLTPVPEPQIDPFSRPEGEIKTMADVVPKNGA